MVQAHSQWFIKCFVCIFNANQRRLKSSCPCVHCVRESLRSGGWTSLLVNSLTVTVVLYVVVFVTTAVGTHYSFPTISITVSASSYAHHSYHCTLLFPKCCRPIPSTRLGNKLPFDSPARSLVSYTVYLFQVPCCVFSPRVTPHIEVLPLVGTRWDHRQAVYAYNV